MSDLNGVMLGPYRVIEQIGRGGMATVYKAFHPATERYVAIKVLPQELATDSSFLARFEREAKVVASLQHVHILPVFDYGDQDGITYLVMPYIPTDTLKRYLEREQPTLEEATRIFCQVAEAVDYAHRKGIIHRDIKPENVLLDDSGNALLSDFGLTKMVESTSHLTGAGVIGTPAYMSPEQGQGRELDRRSDVYSLGVMLYRMVVGQVPFSADTPVAVIFKHINDPLPLPRSRRANLPEAVEAVILKAMAKSPADRYQTALEMAEALRKAVYDLPTEQFPSRPTRPAGIDGIETVITTEPTMPPIEAGRRRNWPILAAGGGAVILIAAAVIALQAGLFGGKDEDQHTPIAGATSSGEAITPTPTVETPQGGLTVIETSTPAVPMIHTMRQLAARSGPGTDYPVITQVEANIQLEIIGISEDGTWYQVWLPDGSMGWVVTSAALVQATGELNNVPVAIVPTPISTEPPVPTPTETPEPTTTTPPEPSATPSEPTATPFVVAEVQPVTLRYELPHLLRSQSPLTSAVFSPDGTRLAAGDHAYQVWVWDVASGEPVNVLLGHTFVVEDVAWSPDATRLATASWDETVRVWDAASGQSIAVLEGHTDQVGAVAWSPDGTLLISAAHNGDTRVWSTSTWEQIGTLTGSEGWITNLAWLPLPGSNRLLTSSHDSTLRVFAVFGAGNGAEMLFMGGPDWSMVTDAAWSPDGSQIVGAYDAGYLVKWDASTGGDIRTIQSKGVSQNAVAWSPDGKLLASGGSDRLVRLWDAATGELLAEIDGHDAPIQDVNFSPDGTLLASADEAGSMWLWNVEAELATPPEVAVEAPDIVVPADAPRRNVYPCEWEDQGTGICLQNGTLERILTDTDLESISPSWSPDGQRIVFSALPSSGSQDKDFRLYIVNTDGTDLIELPHISNDIDPVWSLDGQWLVFHSGCSVGLMRPDGSDPHVIWDAGRENKWCSMRPAWSPDGEHIVVLMAPQTGWQFPMTTELWVMTRDGSEIVTVTQLEFTKDCPHLPNHAFSPDGSQVAFFNPDCQPMLANADGSGEPVEIDEYPWWWEATTFPRWREPAGELVVLERPSDVSGAVGCGLAGLGRGLCIYRPEQEEPEHILADTELSDPEIVSWSPNGERLVFSALEPGANQTENNLYLVSPDGSSLDVVKTDENTLSPAWSPDGEWLAFHSNCDVAIMHPDGSGVRKVWQNSPGVRGCSAWPQWSPDSQRLVVNMQIGDEWDFPMERQIWVIDLANNDRVIPVASLYYENEKYIQFEVAFSPDGAQVAYINEQDQPMLVNADGSGGQHSLNEFPYWWMSFTYPQWGKPAAAPLALPEPVVPVSMVEPCDWVDGGPGLCLHPAEGGDIQRLLTDSDLGGSSQPSWSPDGRQIVFSALEPGESGDRDNDFYIVNADGSDLVEVKTPDNTVAVSWSPNGEWLAFHASCGLAIMHPDGSGFRKIWQQAEGISGCTAWPQWSPDSQRLVVNMQMKTDQWVFPMERQVWVIDLADGDRVTTVATLNHQSEDCVRTEVAFSPDGAQVAYVNEQCQPVLVNADGTGEPVPIEQFPLWWTGTAFPQWGGLATQQAAAPVGVPEPVVPVSIAEPCEWTDGGPGLCVSPVDGSDPQRLLTSGELEGISPTSWSPDGRQIVFSALKPGESNDRDNDFYIMNADGSDLIEVKTSENTIAASWSPDGQWLAFHSNCDLAIMHPDGSGLRKVWLQTDEAPGCTAWPQWSPDSQRLVANMQTTQGSFPIERQIWVFDLADHDRKTQVAILHYESEECVMPVVGFSPNGTQVAYFNEKCQPMLVNADGSGEPVPLEQFPRWWTSSSYPQWGGRATRQAMPEGLIGVVVHANINWVGADMAWHTGQKFRLMAYGAVNICADNTAECRLHGPLGVEEWGPVRETDPDHAEDYPLPDSPAGVLAARADSGQPFEVGAGGVFTANNDGQLQLRVNDNNLDNNIGAFWVIIEPVE